MEMNKDVVAIIAAIIVSSDRDFHIASPRTHLVGRKFADSDDEADRTRNIEDVREAVRIARIIYQEASAPKDAKSKE